ncbi:hypothetical protein QTP88_010314 [Uroleucon formosanum]
MKKFIQPIDNKSKESFEISKETFDSELIDSGTYKQKLNVDIQKKIKTKRILSKETFENELIYSGTYKQKLNVVIEKKEIQTQYDELIFDCVLNESTVYDVSYLENPAEWPLTINMKRHIIDRIVMIVPKKIFENVSYPLDEHKRHFSNFHVYQNSCCAHYFISYDIALFMKISYILENAEIEEENEFENIDVCGSVENNRINVDEIISDHGENQGLNVSEVMNENIILDFKDPGTWPEKITNSQRTHIVKMRINYSEKLDLTRSERDGRSINVSWFFKNLVNGNRCRRTWLDYSKSKNALFCVPCKLFLNLTEKNVSKLALDGFINWKKVSERIPEHENSNIHKKNFCTWKMLEMSIGEGKGGIDKELQDSIKLEENHWRLVLKAIIDIIMHLAMEGSAFRGADELVSSIGKSNDSGKFLNLVKLVSNYNEPLRIHLERHKKGGITYFSHEIQNEFLEIIANKVRSTILSQIKSATYYSILFDCTPDISHEEQMSQVIRYVVVNENGCEIVESFLGFIQVFEKTGESITEDILRSLSKDGIDLANCRGQSYDNGANMAGKWKGVQARISAINELARFIPCTAHSLNLVGLHAAKCSPELEKFFGIIQKLFNFFSSSTQRWDMLKKHLKFSLKGYSTTRWSAKYRAVKSLYLQLAQVIHTCNVLKNGNLCEEATVELNNLLKGITNFNFLCMLTIWNKILMAIDKVNVILQKQNISIDVATNHIKGLLKFIEKFREEGIDEALIESKQKATNLSIEPVFPSIRSRKKKKMPGELADDDISTISEESNFKILMKNVCDRISNGLKERFDSIDEAAQDFSFLDGKFLFTLPTIQLKKHAMDFCIKYEKDIDKIEFILELDSFTQHVFQLENKLIDARSDEILSFILKNGLQDAYPNIYTAYQIFLTLPVTSASCERSFSKLKIIKSYLRSTTKQRRLNNLSIISIEHEIAKTINYDDIINEFASKKARKVVF